MSSVSSFRDPDGFCVEVEGRILRMVYPHAADRVRALIESKHFADWVSAGKVQPTWVIPHEELTTFRKGWSVDLKARASGCALALEQKRVSFVSYPSEWPPEMLFAAGKLTLELQLSALEHGLMLKDATPFNVLYEGSRPVFVDVLSFTRRPKGVAIWPAYAQFVRTFVLPLLVCKRRDRDTHETFLAHRDGLEPEQAYLALTFSERLGLTALKTVTLPTWLGRLRSVQTSTRVPIRPMAEQRAAMVAPMLVRSLSRTLQATRPKERASTWSRYMTCNTYDSQALSAKEAFVGKVLTEWAPRCVLDVGCNTGHFSRIAAAAGASVVGIDLDPVVVGRSFSHDQQSRPSILPLVVNLAWPTPALGWGNEEISSFLDRARGAFDVALALAVVHHFAVAEGIPLRQIFRLLATLVVRGVVVEFVPPDDPQFQRLVRNKDHLVSRLQRSHFEQALHPWFLIAEMVQIPNSGRILYSLSRTQATGGAAEV